MGGLSFIHLGFLAAALAAAVPIIVHLLFRPRARRVEIGSLHFLRAVLQDHSRRRKIRRWLLLALRVAGMILLAALFARPYWRAPDVSGQERELIVLIDRSASMGVGSSERSPFARAQRSADKLTRNLPTGSVVHLAYFDASGVTPAAKPTIDTALRPGYSGTDYGKALAWARDRLVASRRPNRHVVLFTDLQRSGLDRTSLESFPDDVPVEIEDVGRALTANLALDDVLATRTEVRPRSSAIITARVFNAGPFAARGVKVKLALNGPERIERSQTMTVEGESRQVVRFEVPIRRAGLYRGSVEVAGGDDLPFDDRRWLAFDAKAPDRVLLVDGEPGDSVFGQETYYLEMALRLRLPDQGASATPYEPTRITWAPSAGLPDLNPYRIVVLCNVAELPERSASVLREFIASGGHLVVFTGEQVKADAYAALRASGLLPATVLGPSESGLYRFGVWDKNHPLLRPFSDPQYGDLRALRFRRVTRLVPEKGAVVLAASPTGEPLLVEGSKNRGKLLLVAVPADSAWGDWTVNRLYVPVIHQIFGYLTGRLPENGRVRPQPANAELGPGIEVKDDSLIVRNVDPRESEITRASAAEFRAAFHLPESVKSGLTDAEELPPPPSGSQRPDELWRWVAWGLLIVLVAETFLANRTHA